MSTAKTYEELVRENEELAMRLEEATETINAIRTGQVDALVVHDAAAGHQLYTLKTADQTYRVFIEKMTEGAVTLNEDGIILYSNSKFASMVDAPLSKVVGNSFESFVPDECLELYQEVFRKGWKEDTRMELLVRQNDLLIPCQLSVTTLQLDEEPSLSIIVTDLTYQKSVQSLLKESNKQLKEINAELEASNYDLQQFASVASHDLQEPLRKILIFASMLQSKHAAVLPEDSRTYFEKIISSTTRMRMMVSDILNYSRLSTNDGIYEVVNIQEIIDEVMEDYEILLAEKHAKIITENMPEIEVNRAQIKQVFQNLISNSIKFAKKDQPPLIRIFAETDLVNKLCNIIVADNGIGFNKEYQDKIFFLFERLNTKDKYEGSGIGLAITRKILDKHNGTITAEGVEGEGARFTISLPFRQKSK